MKAYLKVLLLSLALAGLPWIDNPAHSQITTYGCCQSASNYCSLVMSSFEAMACTHDGGQFFQAYGCDSNSGQCYST